MSMIDGSVGINYMGKGVMTMKRSQMIKNGTIAVLAVVALTGSALGADHIKQGDGANIILDGGTNQTYVLLGQKATAFVGRGGQEDAISPTTKKDDAAGGIAIGNRTYVRSGSIMIGSHSFKGNMGDVKDIDTSTDFNTGETGAYGFTVATTTIGTNSFTKGFLASTFGDYNIQSSRNVGWGALNKYNLENFGATVVGSLNSNESMTSPEKSGFFSSRSYSGMANSIVGIANRVNNANGALVYGAGNEITNSVKSISGMSDSTKLSDVTKMTGDLRKAIRRSDGGGSTMAFGGGNVADYTNLTMITGVNNTITGTANKISRLDSVIGYSNTVTNASNTKIFGSKNTVEDDAQSNTIFGDNHKITSGMANNVILGNAETEMTLANGTATLLGYNTDVKADGGVALGAGSILSATESRLTESGYDPSTGQSSELADYIWRPTLAAVSIGSDGTATRRITNVAAGINDTDAVNVAQLKQVASSATSGGNLIAGDGIKVVKGADGSWTISTNFKNSGSDVVTYDDTSTPTAPDAGNAEDTAGTTNSNADRSASVATPDEIQMGKAAVIETKLTADDGKVTSLGENGTLGIKGDGTNIVTTVDGSNVKLTLGDNLNVNSISITNGPTINNNGIDMNNAKITNIADGDVSAGSKDVVNGGQLWNVQQGMNGRISHLDTKINRVGAGAAAMANLHPLDYDPDDKWSFSAGFGNYRDANAIAIGAFYRPNENSMVNVSGTFGNGENMLGLGVSFKFGEETPMTKRDLIKTVSDLKVVVVSQDKAMKEQDEKIARLEAMVAQLMAK